MQAIIYCQYGSPDVLQFETISKPQPASDEVLVKVHAAAVNPLDWHVLRGTPYVLRLQAGLAVPASIGLGTDYAGIVEAVGSEVTRFKPGDRVYGGGDGAYAQYMSRWAEGSIALLPDAVSFEQAAAMPIAALTALQALRDKGQLKSGQRVLINGASGGVGTYAVQIAKHMGAHVTGVSSARNHAMVLALGADAMVDYKTEDFTLGTEPYDLILDNVGNRDVHELRRVLTEQGRAVMIGGGGPDSGHWVGAFVLPIKAALTSPFIDQHFGSFVAEIKIADLESLAGMMAEGTIKSVIDRRYPLEQTADAIRYVETGRARGKVIITVVAD